MADVLSTALSQGSRRHSVLRLGLAAQLALSVACSMAPKYERPTAPVQGEYAAQEGQENAVEVMGFREFIKEPRLLQLIELALQENRELRITQLQSEELSARFRIQRAALMPDINAVGARNQQQIVSPLFPDRGGISYTQYTVSAGAMSYELDFFGRVQSLKNKALEAYLASVEAVRSAELSLVAAIATQYFGLQALSEQVESANGIREAANAALELMTTSHAAGARSALDVSTSRALVASIDAQIAVLEEKKARAENALQYLVGRPLPKELPEASKLTVELLPTIKAGLPSDLLERRPDILAAEHKLKAMNADIGAARAAFFPRISLTGTGGLASDEIGGLFSGKALTYQFMPQISIPLFGGGSRFAELDASKVRKLAEVAAYEKTIQTAFREVSDALASYKHLSVQLEAREVAATSQEERYTLANARYEAGLDNFLTVLLAQQDLFTAQQALVQVRLEILSNKIALSRALGGGFP